MTGTVVLLAALAATLLAALLLRARNGRFRAVAPAGADPAVQDGAEASSSDADADLARVGADEIGAPLGSRLTLLQFSSAFCAPCRATRTLLADVVSDRDDVAHVEVDAESHLALVRRLDVLRTPTVLVLDASGRVLTRASGLPRREQVVAVLDA